MIGHYHKFVQSNKCEMFGYFIPIAVCQSANFGKCHFPINDFTKIMFAIVGAIGYKIQTIGTIILRLQTC